MKRTLFTLVTVLALAVGMLLTPAGVDAQRTVKNYFAGCNSANCDNVLTVSGTASLSGVVTIPSGGVLNVATGGLIKNNGVSIDLTDTGTANAVAGIASAYVVARGTNPSSATTGLAAIVACVVTDKRSTAPALDPTHFTVATAAVAGRLDVYAWKPTGSGDATLIASTDADDTIDWVCVGTL